MQPLRPKATSLLKTLSIFSQLKWMIPRLLSSMEKNQRKRILTIRLIAQIWDYSEKINKTNLSTSSYANMSQ